jgi:hypothetical protein
MLTFPCTSCQTPIQAANELVGKSILCPHCGIATTVASAAITTPGALPTYPSSTGVMTADAVEAAEQARRRREADERDVPMRDVRNAAGWLRPFTTVIVVCAVLAILVALLVPSVRRVRESATRTQSINNLKQIALGMHSFHDANKRLPFNGSDLPMQDKQYRAEAGAGNARSGSWAFQILPYVEQSSLLYDGNEGDNENPGEGLPFDTPLPPRVRASGMPCYMCPGRGRPMFEENGGAWTDYFYNNYLNDPKQASKPDGADMHRTLIGITDGSSNTIMVGHGNINTDQYAHKANVTLSTNIFRGGTTGTMRSGNDGETAPGGVMLQQDSLNAVTIGSWGGPFSQGALMCMGDGTVRMFPYSTQNFSSFLTPTGGENNLVIPD